MSKFDCCKSGFITAVLKVSRDALTMIVTSSEIQNVFQKTSEKKVEGLHCPTDGTQKNDLKLVVTHEVNCENAASLRSFFCLIPEILQLKKR